MKNIFIILLIFTLIVCYSIEADLDILREWEEVKDDPKRIRDLMKRLKIYDTMVNYVRGKAYDKAMDYCMDQIGIKFVCKPMVNAVLDEVFG